jgi:hypothetical protein
VCAGVLLGCVGTEATARAQAAASAAPADEARRLLKQGSALFLAKKYGEALVALQGSYDLVPSPNSALVIARCLRELGRPVEAQEMYASAESEARRRAAEGAPKYAQTAESAASEGAAVRATLGSLRIRIEGLEQNPKLEIDGVPANVPADGELLVWHAPGEVNVVLRSASGFEQKQTVTVRAGQEQGMGFGRPELPVTEPPAPLPGVPQPSTMHAETPTGERRLPAGGSPGAGWAKTAAFVSGGFTLVGAGMFTGFGLAANKTYNDLANSPCGLARTCGSTTDNQKRTTGKTEELVANISLAAGSAAGLATITFAIIAITNPPSAQTSKPSRWHLLVGATSIEISGEFP